MRCFVALDISEDVRERLAVLLGRLRRLPIKASWARPENMHLTLKFLGDIEDDRASVLGESLAGRCAGIGAVPLELSGLGVFPTVRKPSVLWVGAGPLEGPLTECVEAVEGSAEAAGFARETRPFKPHVTLGRFRTRVEKDVIRELLEAEGTFDGGAFRVPAVTLYRSELTPNGAVYTRLRDIEL